MPCGDLVVAAGNVEDSTAPQDLAVWRLQLLNAGVSGHPDVEECCAHLREERIPGSGLYSEVWQGTDLMP